jgi:hypothetical protein
MKILGKCKGWAWESSAFDIKKGHVTFDTPSFFLRKQNKKETLEKRYY